MEDKDKPLEAQEPEVAYQRGHSIGNFNFGTINKELTPAQIHLLRLYSINKREVAGDYPAGRKAGRHIRLRDPAHHSVQRPMLLLL